MKDSQRSLLKKSSLENVVKKEIRILCPLDRASYNMARIAQQDATEYSLFKSANCSTYFG